MSLTTNQSDFLTVLDSQWTTFRAALEAALSAGNDGATTLTIVSAAHSALRASTVNLMRGLGAAPNAIMSYADEEESTVALQAADGGHVRLVTSAGDGFPRA